MKKTAPKKADMLLFLAVTLAAAVFFLISLFSDSGAYAVVYVDGEEYGRYPLSSDITFTVHTEWGENTVTLRDGEASISDADCPDLTCVRTHTVSRAGERIICLPHRLLLVIEGEAVTGDGVDLELR